MPNRLVKRWCSPIILEKDWARLSVLFLSNEDLNAWLLPTFLSFLGLGMMNPWQSITYRANIAPSRTDHLQIEINSAANRCWPRGEMVMASTSREVAFA